MAKQTARNNKLLAHVKAKYNSLIFIQAALLVNAKDGGEEAAIKYLGTHVKPEVRDDRMAYLRTVAAHGDDTLKGETKFKLGLGNGTCAAANLDNHSVPALKQVERGKGWVRGTRDQLIEILWYIEAAPPFWTGDGQAPSDCAALRLTSRSWRAKLGLGQHDKLPTPASAQ